MKSAIQALSVQATQPATIPASLALRLTFGAHAEELGGTPVAIIPPMEGRPGYVLIAATGADSEVKGEWGGYGQDDPGAQSEWDGLANTHALLASKHDHAIVKSVTAYRGGGFDDWYLMAKREAAVAYATAPKGLFLREWYWTSTAYAGYPAYAWGAYFDYGSQGYWYKDRDLRARAVRRLIIQ